MVERASAAIRPIGHRISTWSCPATVTGRTRCQPSRVNSFSVRVCTVASNRSAPSASARAHAARTSAEPMPGRRAGRDDQAPALPPAEVRAVVGRAEPDAAEHVSGGVPRDQHDRARVGVVVVEVVPGEEPLPRTKASWRSAR